MARRNRRRSEVPSDTSIELDLMLAAPAMEPLAPLSPFSLPLLEDRREWTPVLHDEPVTHDAYTEYETYEPEPKRQKPRAPRLPTQARNARARAVGSYARPTQNRGELPSQIAFSNPNRVAICIRRKRRKEVLFALRKTGRGSRARRHYNAHSFVRC